MRAHTHRRRPAQHRRSHQRSPRSGQSSPRPPGSRGCPRSRPAGRTGCGATGPAVAMGPQLGLLRRRSTPRLHPRSAWGCSVARLWSGQAINNPTAPYGLTEEHGDSIGQQPGGAARAAAHVRRWDSSCPASPEAVDVGSGCCLPRELFLSAVFIDLEALEHDRAQSREDDRLGSTLRAG